MKLAEALLERKAIGANIAALSARLIASAVVDAGETPEEDASKLRYKLDAAIEGHRQLVERINLTNNTVTIRDGKLTLMQAIALRDALKCAITQYSTIVAALRTKGGRGYVGEAKKVLAPGVVVAEYQTRLDQASKDLRVLDMEIQAIGWTTELVS